jgi:predicted HD superfamily hydrolase involved in NAD metabolism
MAQRLARRWGEDGRSAEVAGWLHDISGIVPYNDYVKVAEALALEVVAEERQAPVLLHQKLSVVIARQVLAVADGPVLSAVGCHTTLRVDSSGLDKVVFVADKIAWDQAGDPPYLVEVALAAEQSLDLAAYCYLDYLRHKHKAMHRWAFEAHQQLAAKVQQVTGKAFP